MTELKKIVRKIFMLFLDITLFTIKIIKGIILPNRKTKGNILSSLFVFFIGAVEILNQFEHGIFQMTKVFKLKHVRKGVITKPYEKLSEQTAAIFFRLGLPTGLPLQPIKHKVHALSMSVPTHQTITGLQPW